MTQLRPSEWLLRIACGVVWYVMSLAFFVEVGALLGWAFGAAATGVRLAILPHCLLWLWLLASDCRDSRN
jgi:hypothetical protein